MQTMNELSVLILSKNNDPNFLSQEKRNIIKSLFGDFATQLYKQEISKLKSELSDLTAQSQREILHLLQDAIRYISILQSLEIYQNNHDLKIEKQEFLSRLDQISLSQEPLETKEKDLSTFQLESRNILNTTEPNLINSKPWNLQNLSWNPSWGPEFEVFSSDEEEESIFNTQNPKTIFKSELNYTDQNSITSHQNPKSHK